MTVREILAKNASLKSEAESMWATAAAGKGFTDEQGKRYEAIKKELKSNTELIAAAAEIASFNSTEAPVVKAEDNVHERSSKEYATAFKQYVMSRGRHVPQILAANVSESDFASGGVLLPTTFDQQVITLANNDSTLRQLATVIPTTVDIPFPVETARGNAAATDEAPGSSGSNAYHQDDPTFSIKTLKAYKATKVIPVSEELFQDYTAFQTYVAGNLGRSLAEFEEGWFVTGAGTTEPQGVVTGATAGLTLASSVSAGIDVVADIITLIGALKSSYLKGASFLMNRATKTALKKQVNDLGIPFWAAQDDSLWGYPVYLSDSMPTIAANAKAILFGNFKQGAIIGDRGSIQTRILDQVDAKNGMIDFVGKRRTDQLVILPEAIKYLRLGAN
jgi:HK97 family phage major capsid protein